MARIVLVEPLTPLGKEVRARFGNELGQSHDLRLLTSDPEQVGTLTEAAGAAAVVAALTDRPAEALEGADIALFCAAPEEAAALLSALPNGSTAILFGADGVHGRAVVAGVNDAEAVRGETLLSPPATVVALAHLAAALRPLDLQELIATALLPASEHGDAALHELFEQARNLVVFAPPPPSPVFGRQLAFNLLPTADGGAAIEASLRAVLGESPRSGVQALQGGIFHGVGLSVALRFDRDPGEDAIRATLAGHAPIEWFEEPDALGPIDAAQSESLLAGGLRHDPLAAGRYWLWATMDNLSVGGALNALGVARAVLDS